MSNIRQKTNADLIGPTVYKTIHSHGEELHNIPYQKIHFETNVSKFGYCVNDNEGINYPIFICFPDNPDGTEFQIGKTGMFEIQEEELPNASETEDPKITVNVTDILVCTEVPFVIDYFV